MVSVAAAVLVVDGLTAVVILVLVLYSLPSSAPFHSPYVAKSVAVHSQKALWTDSSALTQQQLPPLPQRLFPACRNACFEVGRHMWQAGYTSAGVLDVLGSVLLAVVTVGLVRSGCEVYVAGVEVGSSARSRLRLAD